MLSVPMGLSIQCNTDTVGGMDKEWAKRGRPKYAFIDHFLQLNVLLVIEKLCDSLQVILQVTGLVSSLWCYEVDETGIR